MAAAKELDKDLVVKDFAGMNTQASRTAIKEEEFSWLENVMPIGFANMKAVPFQGAAKQTIGGVSINFMYYVNINLTDYMICGTVGGGLYAINLSSYAKTTIAAEGFFTLPIGVDQYQNSRIVIVDAKGYYTWDGTLFSSNNSVVGINITAAGTGYTSVPTITFTGGGGSGATATVSSMLAISAAVAAGGVNYVVGDVLIVSGGTQTGTAKFQVATLAGSAVATVTLLSAGTYTVLPANPAATTSTGVGTGATLTVSWGVGVAAVTATGTGYVAPPTVGFTGGGGSGATATAITIAGPSAGSSIRVYAGRVWVSLARTVQFSAPNSYSDWTVANSAGSFIISDSTLHSNINALFSANNFLYIFGDASINIVSDVRLGTGTPPPTIFSNTNISALIGTNLAASIFPYYRSIGFATRYGFYALIGATPEKISDQMDGVIPLIDFTQPVSGDVANIFDILCMAFQFKYNDPVLGARPLIALFFNKKWFVASQGASLTSVRGGFQNGTPAIFGTDGTNFYQLFSDVTSNIATTVQTALWNMKAPTRMKEALKAGVEMTTGVSTASLMLSLDSDFGSVPATLTATNAMTWVNASSAVVTWVNALSQPVTWVTSGFFIFQSNAEFKGRYLGYTLTATAPAYALNGFLLQYQISASWATKAS